MGKSPLFDAEGPVECVILGKGKALSSVLPIVSVDIFYSINTIPKAVIVIEDGEMSKGTFPLSDGDDLKPGAEIIIKAGYGTKQEQIFKGIVVRHGISISKRGRSCVRIECRHKAIAMTCARKNANFLQKSDDDIVSEIAGNNGVSISSSMGGEAHKEILQYYCTDWDFMMTRAEANGCWLLADDAGMSIEKIAAKGNGDVELTWGTDIIELKAEANALFQVNKVEANAWDITTQQVISGNSSMHQDTPATK